MITHSKDAWCLVTLCLVAAAHVTSASLEVNGVIPSCSDGLLLYFPYEEHYNDVTCHHAIATQFGSSISLSFDGLRKGNVVCFGENTHLEVSFLRTWFALNRVNGFSVAVWIKSKGALATEAAIVNNGNCNDMPGFSIARLPNGIFTKVVAGGSNVEARASLSADQLWHHVALVYDGQNLEVYIDGVLVGQAAASGFMQNNDVPMHIADNYGKDGFTGCMDELRVYERALSREDIANLVNNSTPGP